MKQLVLPSPSISVHTEKSGEFFTRALSKGTMVPYFALNEAYEAISFAGGCGFAASYQAINALRVYHSGKDFGQITQKKLKKLAVSKLGRKDGSIQKDGVTLDEMSSFLSDVSNLEVAPTHFNDSKSLKHFRALIMDASARKDVFLIVNFQRGGLNQSPPEMGHFVTIGGFDADSDHVYIFENAKSKYPSFWVPIEDLYFAMNSQDNMRGWLEVGADGAKLTPKAPEPEVIKSPLALVERNIEFFSFTEKKC